MNVLINYQGRDGAGAALSLAWAQGLKTNGHQVYAAISKDAVNAKEWVKLLGDSNIFWVKTHKDKDKISFLLSTICFLIHGRFALKKKFAGVHFDFSLRTLYCHWACFIDKILSVDSVVAICHDPIPHSGAKNYITKLHYYYIRQSDIVFVLTESFKDIVNKNYNIPLNRIKYVPHGRMNMYEKLRDEKYHISYEKDKFNFLFFGRIEQYKGLDVFAVACGLLSKTRRDFTITVAGSGNFEPYRDLFPKDIHLNLFNMFIPDEMVSELFDGPNVVTIIPYVDATQSGVIPIAYEYNTPIIVSDTGGLREQLDNGKIGLFFKSGSSEELAEKMEYIMDRPAEIDRQINLMTNQREKLNWDIVAAKLVSGIEEVLYG